MTHRRARAAVVLALTATAGIVSIAATGRAQPRPESGAEAEPKHPAPADSEAARSGEGSSSEKPAAEGAKPSSGDKDSKGKGKDGKAGAADAKDKEGADKAAASTEPSLQELVKFKLGPITLVPLALVSVQVLPYIGKDALVQAGDVAERPGFRLREARVGLGGSYEDYMRFAVSMQLSADGDGAKVTVHDAWAGYTQWSFLRAFAGALAVPFSRSGLVGTGYGALIERPLAVTAMAPFHQVGVALDGEVGDGALGYTGGIFNGLERSDRFYEGYVENYAPFGNRFDGLTYAIRLRSEPLGRLGPTIADEKHSDFCFGVGASYFFSDGGTRHVHSAGGDALMHVEGFHLLAEVLWSLTKPEEEPTQPTNGVEQVKALAFVAETGYMILKDALGVNARFEYINPNNNVSDESDNWLITAGAGYQLFDRLLKIQADYTHREEMNGLSLANDSALLQFQFQLDTFKSGEERL